MKLRTIKIDDNLDYCLYDLNSGPEEVSGNILNLVYEMPYFGACGIFPPYHMINLWFASGGDGGGMSPGVSWEPFEIEKDTYVKLVDKVRETDPETLPRAEQSFYIKFDFDSGFDRIDNQMDWMFSVCNKHRDNYRRKAKLLEDRKIHGGT